jgi:hypothetical protein
VDGRGTTMLVWIAILLPLVTVVVYIGVIRSQGSGPPDWLTVPFVASYMVAASLALLVSQWPGFASGARASLRAAAAGGLLVLGFLGAFSIGLPLLLAGVLAAIAAVTTASRVRGAALAAVPVAALLAVAVLVAGFEVSERVIACPATGTMGGGGTGLVTGPYHWECKDGTLHWSSGLKTSGSGSG